MISLKIVHGTWTMERCSCGSSAAIRTVHNSRFHAACTFAFYVVPLEPNLCTAIFYGANMKRSMDRSVKMKLSYLRTYEAYWHDVLISCFWDWGFFQYKKRLFSIQDIIIYHHISWIYHCVSCVSSSCISYIMSLVDTWYIDIFMIQMHDMIYDDITRLLENMIPTWYHKK